MSVSHNRLYTASEKQLRLLADVERQSEVKYYGDYSSLSVGEFIERNRLTKRQLAEKERKKYV